MSVLSAKDVREHTFPTVRFKEGYDVNAVDAFLDDVVETITTLNKRLESHGLAVETPAHRQDPVSEKSRLRLFFA